MRSPTTATLSFEKSGVRMRKSVQRVVFAPEVQKHSEDGLSARRDNFWIELDLAASRFTVEGLAMNTRLLPVPERAFLHFGPRGTSKAG